MVKQISRILPIVVFVVAMSGFAPPSQAMSQSEAQAKWRQATALMEQDRWNQARTILSEIARSPYSDKNVLRALGECYQIEFDATPHDLAVAQSLFQRALVMDPEYGGAYSGLVDLELKREHYENALKLANKTLSVKEPDKYGLYQRAKIYAATKQYGKALPDLNSWIKSLSPERLKTDKASPELMLKANILERLERWDEACIAYREIGRFHFDLAEYSIIRCLTNANEIEKAIAETSLLIAKSPVDDEAFHVRSQLKIKQNDLKGALSDATCAIELNPLNSYYVNRADIYKKLGKTDLAAKDLQHSKQ